jgi:hypothetical protein
LVKYSLISFAVLEISESSSAFSFPAGITPS